MSLLEKAKELGQGIKESEEFRELQRASQNIQDNTDAQQLIQDIQMVQSQIEFAQQAGVQPTQEQIEEFNNIKLQMDSNIVIRAYIKAQEDYNQMMQEVNNTISGEINS